MFRPGVHPGGSARFNYTIFDPANEPSFTTPYLFSFAGRQDLTVERSRFIAQSYYSPTPGGIPGNSDAGAMETWILWNIIGLYPMTGQTTFLVGSPWFSDLTISLGGGRSLRITSANGSDSSYYVQSLRVNGEPWTRSWVTWSDVFENGGTMDFVLGPQPANWTTGPDPPSPGTEGHLTDVKGDQMGGPAADHGPTHGEEEAEDGSGGSSSPAAPLEPILIAGLGGAVMTLGVLGLWVFIRRREAKPSAQVSLHWFSSPTVLTRLPSSGVWGARV